MHREKVAIIVQHQQSRSPRVGIYKHQENEAATFLHVGCEPNVNDSPQGYGWGHATVIWETAVGIVVVVGEDEKSIFAEHAAAINHWSKCKLLAAVQTRGRRRDGQVIMSGTKSSRATYRHTIRTEKPARKFRQAAHRSVPAMSETC